MAAIPGLLAGKVSIITGTSSGLGRAIALAFSEHGATVICADRHALSKMSDQPTHEIIHGRGGKSRFVPTDVTKASSVKELVKTTTEKFGRVDVYVRPLL
jgi:NAD(P)-dependent dehydrogenase (short-subunit alcohol dehydrogenase family)